MNNASNAKGYQPWPPEVQKLIEEKQEHAYSILAAKLGLGSDPAKAYAKLSVPQMPLSKVSWQEFAKQYGVDLTSDEEEGLRELVQAQFGHYFTEPPTPYEDSNRHVVIAMVLDEVLAAFAAIGKSFEPKPVVATLPSGRLNAVVKCEDKTQTPIIFLEQGLFRFLYEFSLAMGWVLPAFSAEDLCDDKSLARHRGPHTLPFGGGPFTGVLYDYVVSGSPIVASTPVPKPPHNELLCALLTNQMSRFVIAHELSHFALGHYDQNNKTESWDKEYHADAHALLVLSQAAQREGQSRAFTSWACDLCLLCLDLLDRGMGVLTFGSTPSWVSQSHPSSYSRSRRLREILEYAHITSTGSALLRHLVKRAAAWLGFRSAPTFDFPVSSLIESEVILMSQMTDDGYSATAELGGMSYAIINKLWEFGSFPFLLAHQQGTRPSPIWNDRIASCFKPH